MTPDRISMRVVADRAAVIDELLDDLRSLPTQNSAEFFSDRRNIWAAESCLRRCLEGLLDLGRHILAKGFGVGVSEYKEIAQRLEENRVLSEVDAEILRRMAGYRNRMVHYYHEVTKEELLQLCANRLDDIEVLLQKLLRWVEAHPEKVHDAL